ncbi:MAG: hypothetical protein GXP49_07185 [Deltaproteobacteria bacterium]|nr:hypothetical protein [Deltaproteobacteria bacterium]
MNTLVFACLLSLASPAAGSQAGPVSSKGTTCSHSADVDPAMLKNLELLRNLGLLEDMEIIELTPLLQGETQRERQNDPDPKTMKQ